MGHFNEYRSYSGVNTYGGASILELVGKRKAKEKLLRIKSFIFIFFLLFLGSALFSFIFLSANRNFKKSSLVINESADFKITIPDIKPEIYVSNLSISAKQELNSIIHYIGQEIISKSRYNISNPYKLAEQIVIESLINDEDPFFITAVVFSESSFRTDAKSHVGALGLMQIMPATGKYIAKISNTDWNGVSSLKNPELNLQYGIIYLKYLKKLFNNNINKVLIAYNWGPGNVQKKKKAPKISTEYSNKIQRLSKKWSNNFEINKYKFKFLGEEFI